MRIYHGSQLKPEAFARLKFAGFSVADHLQYYPRRQARLEIAERQFMGIQSESDFKGLYMNVILSEKIGSDDERIPRNAAP